jgi:hypothetical protein
MDFEGKFKINKAGCKMGYTKSLKFYINRLRLLHPKDKNYAFMIFCRIKGSKTLHLENRFYTKEGSYFLAMEL